MKPIFAILLLLAALPLSAQTVLKGRVIDQQGAPIPGANVYIEGSYDGSFTDENGHFRFKTTASGVQSLIVSFLSYETFKKSADVATFPDILVKLKESVNALDAVVITAGTFEAGEKARVSVLKPLDIVTTASAAGDIVGALTTLPGTQVVGEDGRLFVRGGEANETQTFVDGIRVPQPYSPSGNNLPTRSRFSPFLFSGVSFSTGGYSAEYGEALSSVLTLNTIDEASQNQTDISLMTVGLGVGNTRKWEKQSVTFNLAYINLGPYQKIVPQAVDWNKPLRSAGGEMVYRFHFKNGLLKAYGAYDVTNLDINEEDINQAEKRRVALRNANTYGNLSYKGTLGEDWIIHSGLSYGSGGNQIAIDKEKVTNTENALHMKLKLTRIFSDRIKVYGGVDYFYTDFDETFTADSGLSFPLSYANHLGAVYLETDIFFSKKLAMKIGGRASHNELLNEYPINPRASMAYKVSNSSQFSLAFGDFVQAPNTDFLKFNTDLRSEKSLHYILNYQYNKNGRLFRTEAYYKNYRNLVTFDTEQAQVNSLFQSNGNGYAQGLDVFWRDGKTFKNTDYWISYSYIDTEREYLNFPEAATPSFIANHTLSVVTKHWIDKLTSQIGFSYTINSGRPFHNPNEAGFLQGKTKAFQSLSFNWAYLISQQKILYCSVSNILGTDNIFGYQYAHTPDMNGEFQRRAIGQGADRFFFIGFFWTISDNKKTNQLDNL